MGRGAALGIIRLRPSAESKDTLRAMLTDQLDPAGLDGVISMHLIESDPGLSRPINDAPSTVSGLLIGTDVRIGLTWPAGARIGVMGRPDLTRLYAAAIGEAGREAIELDGEQCFLAGIVKIAEMIG